MSFFTKDSLQRLKERIVLPEVLADHIKLDRHGANYKALCPFHDERTPSFTVSSGSSHYHCFGCGAHGDAISFLMLHAKLSFQDAVESLAEKFGVPLEKEVEFDNEPKGPSRVLLKETLAEVTSIYHYLLLNTKEGHEALSYLYSRGIDLDFIIRFKIGFAPKGGSLLHAMGKENHELLVTTGVCYDKGRDFFQDRIVFPIYDARGHVIGFSGRKFKEGTTGGKYINTPETPLFKKSQILFGLFYSRKRIAKDKKALLVEGQLDALRLIDAGFDFAVAALGTAFGEQHAKELISLGISTAYICFDRDDAGLEATYKVGDFFLRKGISVRVVDVTPYKDPDEFLQSVGAQAFSNKIDTAPDFLEFCWEKSVHGKNLDDAGLKQQIVQTLVQKIRSWEQPVIVHESLQKLATLSRIPPNLIGIDPLPARSKMKYAKRERAGDVPFDPHFPLEADLLQTLFLFGESHPDLIELAKLNLEPALFKTPDCRLLFETFLSLLQQGEKIDLLTLSLNINDAREQEGLAKILQRKINPQKAKIAFIQGIEKMIAREWMTKREAIRNQMQQVTKDEKALVLLAKEFEALRITPPQVKYP